MTNVPGAGFFVVLVAVATLFALSLLAGVSLVVARLSRLSLVRSLAGVHAASALVGALALFRSLTSSPSNPFGIEGNAVVLSVLAVVVGLLTAAVVEGVPVAVGAVGARLLADVPWATGVWYGTLGYVAGGFGGALVVGALTGSVGMASLGSVLALPTAILAGPLLGVTAPRLAARAAVR